MNKYNLFLLFFLAACSPKEHNDAVESVPPNEYLTIIVKNTASHPVRIATEASYIKPAEYSQIAYQQSDTLRLALQPFEEISFSHKGVFMQKTFAGRGDTLILHSSEEKIEYEVKHWNPSIQTMLTAYTDFRIVNL